MLHSSGAQALVGYSFLHVFANDKLIDPGELAFLERIALADGQVDDEERNVLRIILSKVTEHQVTPAVWSEIERFRAAHGI